MNHLPPESSYYVRPYQPRDKDVCLSLLRRWAGQNGDERQWNRCLAKKRHYCLIAEHVQDGVLGFLYYQATPRAFRIHMAAVAETGQVALEPTLEALTDKLIGCLHPRSRRRVEIFVSNRNTRTLAALGNRGFQRKPPSAGWHARSANQDGHVLVWRLAPEAARCIGQNRISGFVGWPQ